MVASINDDFSDEKNSLDHLKKTVSSDDEKYDFLIVSPMSFVRSLYKLASHKKHCGIDSKIVSLNEIYNSYYFPIEGRDRAEQIKYFIKNAIEKWDINYVLLVGGARQLPVRYVHNLARHPDFDIFEPCFISDLYYADIYNPDGSFSSWDTNGNGIYGEWMGESAEDKNIDLQPDIYLGRLPCKNRFEVKIMINKIINYERNAFGKTWFNNVVVVGGDTYPKDDDIYEGEMDNQKVLEFMKNFNHIKLSASDGDLTKRGVFKIIKAVNKGCGFLVLSGHGNPMFWNTHLPRENKKISKFSLYHMPLLTNRDMLPVCINSGCNNSEFDTTPLNLIRHPKESWNKEFDYAPKCWNWAITHKIGGGSIATIGSTGLVYLKWDEDTGRKADGWSYLVPRFFQEYSVDRTNKLGDIWGKVIREYLKKFPIDWDTPSICFNTTSPKPDAINAKSVQEFILFGDPTLKIGGYDGVP